MPCPHCPHCQAQDNLADLVLPDRPSGGGRGGMNRGFYRAFAAAYDLAVGRAAQPMVLLRTANPGLTPSQCREYLKRARSLGFVQTAKRSERIAASTAVGSVPSEPVHDEAWYRNLSEAELDRLAPG